MRIVCTVTNDLSHDQRMQRICATLQAAGHEVTLVGRELPDSSLLPDRAFRQYRIRCRYHYGKRFYAEFNYRLWSTLRKWDFDVICAVDLDTLLPATMLAGKDRKLVFDAHEWFSETPEVVGRPLIRSAWRGLGRALVPRTDARYTVAPVLAGKLEADYGHPFGVVRNLPFKRTVTIEENSGGVIIYQGVLNPGRGLDVAIESLTLLPGLSLWIVGDGPERPRLELLVEQLGVSEQVRFMGFTPPEQLPELTGRAWLGLNLLADSSPNYYYSLANKAFDYIQAGLPSLQMDYPEYRALNGTYDCFLLLSTLTAPALAAQIHSLLEDPQRYEQLRRHCRRAAEDLCWEREAPKLLAIYDNL